MSSLDGVPITIKDLIATKGVPVPIAREVTEKLKLRLSGAQQQQFANRETTNPEAYQFYLRGRYFWNKRTADGIRKAINQFQKAICGPVVIESNQSSSRGGFKCQT